MLSQFYSIQITFIHLIQNATLIQFKSLAFSIQITYIKGVRAHKIPRFNFSIEECGVLGEYVEVAVTRNIQFYASTAIHHSRSIFGKERKVICICGHQR